MIKHIVMWKLIDENKAENASKIKTMLEGLVGKVDELVSAEVGIDLAVDADAYDAVLVSTFKTVEDLKAYQIHPLHVEISSFVKSVRTDRKTVDFEF